jgi:hypothetical protein
MHRHQHAHGVEILNSVAIEGFIFIPKLSRIYMHSTYQQMQPNDVCSVHISIAIDALPAAHVHHRPQEPLVVSVAVLHLDRGGNVRRCKRCPLGVELLVGKFEKLGDVAHECLEIDARQGGLGE